MNKVVYMCRQALTCRLVVYQSRTRLLKQYCSIYFKKVFQAKCIVKLLMLNYGLKTSCILIVRLEQEQILCLPKYSWMTAFSVFFLTFTSFAINCKANH